MTTSTNTKNTLPFPSYPRRLFRSISLTARILDYSTVMMPALSKPRRSTSAQLTSFLKGDSVRAMQSRVGHQPINSVRAPAMTDGQCRPFLFNCPRTRSWSVFRCEQNVKMSKCQLLASFPDHSLGATLFPSRNSRTTFTLRYSTICQ